MTPALGWYMVLNSLAAGLFVLLALVVLPHSLVWFFILLLFSLYFVLRLVLGVIFAVWAIWFTRIEYVEED